MAKLKVFMNGSVGLDPKVEIKPNGIKCVQFTMQDYDSYKDKVTGQKVENKEWYSIYCYGITADFVENYIHKGDIVSVEGSLKKYKHNEVDKTYKVLIKAKEVNKLNFSNELKESNNDIFIGNAKRSNTEDDLPF